MPLTPSDARPQPNSAWQTLLLFVAIAGILFVISRYAAMSVGHIKGNEHPAVGAVAPQVAFAPLTGATPIRLAEQKGKVVLINFWGTWCPPCRAEFPRLQQATRPFLDHDDFIFASVCIPATDDEPKSETAKDAAEFLKQHNASFEAVYDPESKSFAAILVATKTQQSVVPFTVVIDRSGKFAGVWIGYESGDEEDVAKTIHAALEAKDSNR
jgi:cytochrome c biogenesis protein CcmG, thiol:disulfide interchange protein DsbE